MAIPPGADLLLDFYVAQFKNELSGLTEAKYSQLSQILSDFLRTTFPYSEAQLQFSAIAGSAALLETIRKVVDASDEPLPVPESDGSLTAGHCRRRNIWTWAEDTRLLCGIYRFGLNNWEQIARFVGHSRNRAQCAQRWNRGLDPGISKNAWNASENAKLVELVQAHGECAWMKVSSLMGNRSDVQCRYHYHQLRKQFPAPIRGATHAMPTPPRPMRPRFPGVGAFLMMDEIDRERATVARNPGMDLIVSLLNVH
jgi:hypothetical protein